MFKKTKIVIFLIISVIIGVLMYSKYEGLYNNLIYIDEKTSKKQIKKPNKKIERIKSKFENKENLRVIKRGDLQIIGRMIDGTWHGKVWKYKGDDLYSKREFKDGKIEHLIYFYNNGEKKAEYFRQEGKMNIRVFNKKGEIIEETKNGTGKVTYKLDEKRKITVIIKNGKLTDRKIQGPSLDLFNN